MDTQDGGSQALPDWLLERVAIAKEDISRLEFAEHVFVVNHSGGKDSQAMFNFLRLFIPANANPRGARCSSRRRMGGR